MNGPQERTGARERGIGVVSVMAGLLVVGVSAFVFFSRGERSEGVSRQVAAETEEANGKRTYALPGARLTDETRAAYRKAAEQGVVSEALRSSVLPMNTFTVGQGGEFRLPVWFATRESCMPGDLTALEGDVRRSDKKRVIVSLEPLLPEDDVMTPSVQRLSLDGLHKGPQRIEFQVRLKRFPAQLGLFVCRDDAEQGRCATKELVDYGKVFAELDEALAKKQPPAAPDRIYAFQYVLFDQDGRASTFSDSPVAPQSWDILARQSKERFAGSTDPVKAIERARTIAKALDSVPMASRAGQMVFVLPSRGEKCPSLAQLAASPGAARLRAVLDELPPERRPQ